MWRASTAVPSRTHRALADRTRTRENACPTGPRRRARSCRDARRRRGCRQAAVPRDRPIDTTSAARDHANIPARRYRGSGLRGTRAMGDPTDSRWFRQVLGQYPTGVCVVTATQEDGSRAGFVVGSFTSVSLDPPLVAFFPDKASTSWPKIHRAGRVCGNILSADQEHLCRRFASKAEDKFVGLQTRAAGSGSPVLEGVVAWIDCDLD